MNTMIECVFHARIGKPIKIMISNKFRIKNVFNSMCFTSILVLFISFLCFKCVFCVEMKPFISIAQEETSKSNSKYQAQSLQSNPRNSFAKIDKSNFTNGTREEVEMFEASIRSEHTSNFFEDPQTTF